MSFLKKLPWATLALLLVTYSVFGWLFSSNFSWNFWLIETALVILIALLLTAPLTLLKAFFSQWMNSDTRAFLCVIASALAGVFIMTWFSFFAHILVLLSAGALTRLDLQTAGFSGTQSFWIIAIVSMAGFSLGVLLNQLI